MLGWEVWWHPVVAFLAAFAAGAANAVAGAGTVISFPTLVWLGLPPVQANATNAVGLWPGSASAAWSYRTSIGRIAPRWWLLVLPSIVGGAIGAWLLIRLPPSWFEGAAPFLVMGAAGLVAVEPTLRGWIRSGGAGEAAGADGQGADAGPKAAGDARAGRWIVAGGATLFAISLYGGYFGAGIGILTLGSLSLLGLHDLHRANGLKNVLALTMKAAAVVLFSIRGIVLWHAALLMAAGSFLGGWAAGHLIQRVEPETLRWVVVAVGVAMGALMLFQL